LARAGSGPLIPAKPAHNTTPAGKEYQTSTADLGQTPQFSGDSQRPMLPMLDFLGRIKWRLDVADAELGDPRSRRPAQQTERVLARIARCRGLLERLA
jgi:hypothetical protein